MVVPPSERSHGRKSGLRGDVQLEQVEFELSDGAQTDCPVGNWLFQPEPHGQRLDGLLMFAVVEIQGGVEATDGVRGWETEKSRGSGQKGRGRNCQREGNW